MRRLSPGDPEFPEPLLHVSPPPRVLYLRGRLPPPPRLAVVGSRRPSDRARNVAREMVGEVVRAGVSVVSGLAYGIDAVAHEAALGAGGLTLAVLASGLDRPSPVGNRRLARRILEAGGGWLSEHPPGVDALAFHFRERNRLISGLAQAVLVVEARERSGSLITANHALEQGRDLFVVPGPVDTDQCRGSNALLRNAHVALDAADVLLRLGVRRARRFAPGAVSPEAQRVLAALREGPCEADLLALRLDLAAPALALALLELELARRVVREGSCVRATLPAS